MKSLLLTIILVATAFYAGAQSAQAVASLETQPVIKGSPQKVVIITGARFSYPLAQRLIDDYNNVNPDVQIIIESRGSNDPARYDILAEVYDREDISAQSRNYVYLGRYAVLPVANASSEFARVYEKNGLTGSLIKQVYFFNPFADTESEERVKAPFTVYTRLQKAGVPIIFSSYFGFTQKDINGKAIAGSDEHLLKALKRDSTGVSYLPLSLIYDLQTRKPVDGLKVLPVDLDGNGRINDEEKFYNDLDTVIGKLQNSKPKDLRNIPLGFLHLSVEKDKASPEASAFLSWVSENAKNYLKQYGYLDAGNEPVRTAKTNSGGSATTN
jgi:phosphate transport system substrate-binding protein